MNNKSYINIEIPKKIGTKKINNKLNEKVKTTNSLRLDKNQNSNSVNTIMHEPDMYELNFDVIKKYDNIAVPASYVAQQLKIDVNRVRLNMKTGYWNLGIVCSNKERDKYIIMSYRLYQQLGIVYPPAFRKCEVI